MSIQKTFIIKPTMKCNLRCEYCYEFNKNGDFYQNKDLDIRYIANLIKSTATLFQESRVLWMLHGGEPLLKNFIFIKDFVDTIRAVRKEYKVDFQFALQTNATLLTSDIVKLLEDNVDLLSGRIVSISIDGPQYINDVARHTLSGESSFKKTINGIKLIKQSNLKFSTISVIGRHNIEHPNDVFYFNKQIGSQLCKFIPCYNFNDNGDCEKLGIKPIEYAKFMCDIFDIWMHNITNIPTIEAMVIDPIVTILSKLSKSFVTWCEYREEKCDNFICLYPDGELWLCDSMNHATMRSIGFIGNIYDMSPNEFAKAVSKPCSVCNFGKFYTHLMDVCKKCDIYMFCKGGCLPMRNALKQKSSLLSEDYCKGKHILFNHIKKGFDHALSQLKVDI